MIRTTQNTVFLKPKADDGGLFAIMPQAPNLPLRQMAGILLNSGSDLGVCRAYPARRTMKTPWKMAKEPFKNFNNSHVSRPEKLEAREVVRKLVRISGCELAMSEEKHKWFNRTQDDIYFNYNTNLKTVTESVVTMLTAPCSKRFSRSDSFSERTRDSGARVSFAVLPS